jgi:AcrR family transcriptional regulator
MARAGLSTEAVVAAAAALADREGLEAVTLARLAADAGVRPPSLYAHIDGLDDVRRRLAMCGAHELAAALREAATGRSGGDALRAFAAAHRDHARCHPGTYLAAQRAPAKGDAEARAVANEAVDVLRAVLAGYGLEGDDAIHAARAVRAALHGFAMLEAGGGFGIKLDVDESFARLVELLDRGLLMTGSS